MFQVVFTCFSPYLVIAPWGVGSPKGLVNNPLVQLFTSGTSKIEVFGIFF